MLSRGLQDARFERLLNHFTDSELIGLTLPIALTGLFNRVNQALDSEMEETLMAQFSGRGLSASAFETLDKNAVYRIRLSNHWAIFSSPILERISNSSLRKREGFNPAFTSSERI